MPSRWTGTARTLALLLPFVLLLVAGSACDDPTRLSAKEQRIAVGTEATSLCWDQETGLATTHVLATVFGEDGSVAEGTEVHFEADWSGATFDVTDQRTDETGRAIVEISTTRPDGDELRVTGSLADGSSDDVTIQVPRPPLLQFVPDNPQPAVGDEFFIHVYVVAPCNLNRITFRLEWDPAVLQYLPGECEETGLFDAPVADDSGDGSAATDADGDGSAEPERIPTELLETPGEGAVDITYRRADSPPTGTGSTGTYLKLHFRAIGAGDAALAAPFAELAPPDGRPYELMTDDYWDVSPVTVVEPEGDGGE